MEEVWETLCKRNGAEKNQSKIVINEMRSNSAVWIWMHKKRGYNQDLDK